MPRRALIVFLLAWLTQAAEVREASVDAAVQAALDAWRVPGAAVAIVHNGQAVYVKGHGVRKLGAPDPVTPDSLFAIASTTKAFTTTALAQLVEQGRLQWDDPVRKHLEYFHLSDPLADANVTVRDLVTHRTGMPRHDALWYRTGLSREEVIRRLGETSPTKQFRQEYQYQNIQFLAAGELIAKVTGQSWDDFIRTRFLDPLGMKNTTSRFAQATAQAERAMPHRRLGDGATAAIDWINFENVGAAGCLNSSARDLAQWVRFHLRRGEGPAGRLLGEKFLAETYEPQTVIRPDRRGRELAPATTQRTYASGWFLDHYRGELLIDHTGSLDGFRAMVTLLPQHNLGIVVLANLGPTHLPQALTYTLIDQILALPARDWNAQLKATLKSHEDEDLRRKQEREAKRAKDTKPSHGATAYAGRYRAPGYGLLEVIHTGQGLRIECLTQSAALEHYHYDVFQARNGSAVDAHPLEGEHLAFHTNANGDVASVRFLNTEFRRVP